MFSVSDCSFCISIHTFCEEGDSTKQHSTGTNRLFQSTPSVKRVTSHEPDKRYVQFISIHTLCEEGDKSTCDNG